MSFFDSSPNFIRQKLIIEFKGLTQEETLAKYEGVKSKTREKLREYYPKVEDKFAFYKEIFELLGARDGEYILLNLFFELDIDSIVLELKQNNIINSIKCFNPNSLSYKFLSEINKNQDFQIDLFLKDNFTNLIELPIVHWNDKNQNNELIREFIKWLNITNSDHDVIEKSIILFDKIWSVFFSNPFNELKARVFVSVLMDEINRSSSVLVHQHMDRVKKITSELFINRRYSIILDGVNFNDELTQTYQTERVELEELLNKYRSKDKSFVTWSYKEIFQAFDEMNDSDQEIALKDIKSKLASGDIPNESDLTLLDSIDDCDEIRNLINQKCYLFENLLFNTILKK